MMRERLPDRREAETFEITHRTHDGVERRHYAEKKLAKPNEDQK